MKLCKCGCGLDAPISKRSDARTGAIAGQPVAFIKGHNRRMTVAPACGYVIDEATGCWNWKLGRDPAGYGFTSHKGKKRAAHIVEWEKVNGPKSAGMELDHTCRNVACVNPGHLEQVTPTENKRRSRATKIDAQAAAEIKSMCLAPKQLAKKFGVTESNISHIRRGASWSEIEASK